MAIKKEAYLSLSAMLRAREPRLLNAERAGRMLDAASAEEAGKLLADCGYGDLSGMNASCWQSGSGSSMSIQPLSSISPFQSSYRASGESYKRSDED